MEMCYDGALVMPSNYAVMDEAEMTYVEGGAWSAKTVWYNIVGAAGQFSVVKWCAQKCFYKGKSIWAWACAGVNWAKGVARSALASFCAKLSISAATVSRVLGFIVGMSTVLAVAYLGTHRVFY